VINSNLPPIFHRFQVMADYMSNFASDRGSLHFDALVGGDSLRILHKRYSAKNQILWLHSLAECIRLSSITLTYNRPQKLPNSAK